MQHRTVEAGGAPSARDGRCLGRHHEPQGRSRGIDALIRADSWAFLQVRHLEALLYCRLSGARLRPGFHLPISSALADIFCFDPLMARERHLVWACRLPDPDIALAARRLQLAESWPGTCRHGSLQQDYAVQALHPLDCRHLPAVQCKTGGRIRPVPESLVKIC